MDKNFGDAVTDNQVWGNTLDNCYFFKKNSCCKIPFIMPQQRNGKKSPLTYISFLKKQYVLHKPQPFC